MSQIGFGGSNYTDSQLIMDSWKRLILELVVCAAGVGVAAVAR